MSIQGGYMQYVPCPTCGDPVAGRIPPPEEEQVLTCVHCKTRFPFARNEIRGSIVVFDQKANRWKVGKPDGWE